MQNLAAEPGIEWDYPCDNAYNKARARINAKLKTAKLPWRLKRGDNKAKLIKTPPQNRPKKA